MSFVGTIMYRCLSVVWWWIYLQTLLTASKYLKGSRLQTVLWHENNRQIVLQTVSRLFFPQRPMEILILLVIFITGHAIMFARIVYWSKVLWTRVPYCGSTGHRWIPFTEASDVEFWCFLRSALEQRLSIRHRANHDVTVMVLWSHRNSFGDRVSVKLAGLVSHQIPLLL